MPKALLRKEHPDVSKLPDAKQRWQELSNAYDALNDPEPRLRMCFFRVARRGGWVKSKFFLFFFKGLIGCLLGFND